MELPIVHLVAGYGPHASRPHFATSLLLRVRMLTYVKPFWQKGTVSPIHVYAWRGQVTLSSPLSPLVWSARLRFRRVIFDPHVPVVVVTVMLSTVWMGF